MIPPPLYPPFPYDMNKTVINNEFPTLIPAIAKSTGVHVIDVFDALGGKALRDPTWFCDGCHPLDVGYDAIASLMSRILRRDRPTKLGVN